MWVLELKATVILAYHSDRLSVARNRFEVLGVRGVKKKLSSESITFYLVLVTFGLRTNPAEPHGNRNRGGVTLIPPTPHLTCLREKAE